MPITHENALKAPVGRFFRSQGYKTAYEFPVGNRTIDVIAWNEKGRIVAVELKIASWLRGLHQATFYASWSDQAYLAVPVERSRAAATNHELFLSSGVGLLTVSKGKCALEIEARERRNAHVGEDRKAVLTALRRRAA